MTLQTYVNDVLQIPVTRIGNKHTVEAIELVLDTHDHKFYPKLSQVTGKTVGQLENSLRDAKEKSLSYMNKEIKDEIFSSVEGSITNTSFIVLAAQYYKERYENKEEG